MSQINRHAEHLPPKSQSFSGCYPIRFEGAPNGPLEGRGEWVGIRDFEHATLCRAFKLDPARFYFDLPSTVRGIGPSSRGAGGIPAGRRRINGFVFMAGRAEPVAKLSVCFESERFSDYDPTNERDFYDLSHS